MEPRRSSIVPIGQTVLAASKAPTPITVTDVYTANKKLFEFHGYDGEDFQHFTRILNDYFGLKNISDDTLKLATLKAMLTGIARQDLEEKIQPLSDMTYAKAVEILKQKHDTDETQEYRQDAFHGITQLEYESPQSYLCRIQEAANIAGITDRRAISSRFKHGLLPEIQQHCLISGARSHEDVLHLAQGYWLGFQINHDSNQTGRFINANQFYEDYNWAPHVPLFHGRQEEQTGGGYQSVSNPCMHFLQPSVVKDEPIFFMAKLAEMIETATIKALVEQNTQFNQQNRQRNYDNNGSRRYNGRNNNYPNRYSSNYQKASYPSQRPPFQRYSSPPN
ncbi:hypothetical protein A0J61_10403 [Choanephora cucurbitarum]|uniref:Uncharacterized protein n=1 Tax=Choanephora cucurbitarum TaxID=101091 RepID=A0A1C7MXI2_9FUNG|nr:hypothetical protein A0J61_10403 [Choanephora cucurbitarum]